MTYTNPDALVGTDWLAENLTSPEVRVLDGSWYLPAQKRDGKTEFAEAHIPGARHFDIDEISDRTNDLPHMLPSAADFAATVGAMGIGNENHVVVYDGIGLQSAGRVWWMFRAFGHDRVSVLNGGLPKWRAEGHALTADAAGPAAATFTAEFRGDLVRGVEDMKANLGSAREQVLDARAQGRFDASEPEPRQGLRGGHIPGSRCLPYPGLIDPETKTVRDAASLRGAFEGAGIDLAAPIVTTCGSGVSACILGLGLYLIGRKDVAVYDGSWSEWGSREDTPVEPE